MPSWPNNWYQRLLNGNQQPKGCGFVFVHQNSATFDWSQMGHPSYFQTLSAKKIREYINVPCFNIFKIPKLFFGGPCHLPWAQAETEAVKPELVFSRTFCASWFTATWPAVGHMGFNNTLGGLGLKQTLQRSVQFWIRRLRCQPILSI